MLRSVQMTDAPTAAAASWLSAAEAVLVVAGAGMSIGCERPDHGRSFVDPLAFKDFYPGLEAYGVRNAYQATLGGGFDNAPRPQAEGGLLKHAHLMSGGAEPHHAYKVLQNLLEGKEYFVHTSNVDGLFAQAGFDKERIYTPQGKFARRQCQGPCSNDSTWCTRPQLDKLLPHLDQDKTTMVTPLPEWYTTCPFCRRHKAFFNLRGSDNFIHRPYQMAQDRLVSWLEQVMREKKRLIVLEVGAGFSTPSVTRWPAESIAREAGAPFVRINPDHHEIPPDMPAAVGLPRSCTEALLQLQRTFTSSDSLVTARNAADRIRKARSVVISIGEGFDQTCRSFKRKYGHFDWRIFLKGFQDPNRLDTSGASV